MTKPALASMLHDLRRIFEAADERQQSDRQLLERFLAAKDEAAFAALVRRHGRLVLSVCRHVLNDEADVEDAFQATFLVLLRKASAVRWQASIGNWLFGVAHRLAVQARANAARRRRRENEAGHTRPEAYSPPDLSWREAVGLLHEELDRLPDAYQLPLLLCCLDGKTREEAAQVLGCSAGSIKGRLERGREMLRARLLRRGLTLSGTLLAALVDAPPATPAPPPALVQTTLRAAMTGAYSRSIAVLIRGATSTLFTSKVRIAAGLLLTVSLLAVGGSRALTPPEAAPVPEKPAARPAQQAAKPAPEKTVVVRGRVLDPDDKPVKDARLYWPRVPKTEPRTTEDIENVEIAERAKTDAEGRFRFELPRSDIQQDWLKNVSLLAVADGYGVDGVELPKDDPSPEVTLRLVKDQPIEGRIVSTEGKPLAGVNVRIMGVGKTRQERLDDFLAAWKRKDPHATDQAFGKLSGQMFLPPHEKSFQAETDKDGRFRLQGVGVERMALVRLRAPGLTPAPLFVINRADFDPTAWNKAARDNVPPEARPPGGLPLLYGPKIEYVAEAGRRIEGTVREAHSGKPVPGYRLTINVPNGFNINAVSDQEGKYQLLGVPKLKQYALFAQPPANSAWLPAAARGEDAAGLRTVQVDFTVARGIVVSGRVLDRATGKGVHARLRFVPLPGNKFFGKPGYDYHKHRQYERTMTDVREAGRYQLAVMPGPGVLMIQALGFSSTANGGQKLNPYKQAEFDAKDREHVEFLKSEGGNRSFRVALENQSESLNVQNAVKVLDLAPDAGTATCDLFVERGATRIIQIEDADGKPLKGTTVAGITTMWPIARTIKDSTCTIFALDSNKPRRLSFLHASRNLAGSLLLRGDEKEPVVVRLGRAGVVKGRVLDRDRQPLAGANINLIWSDGTGFDLYREAQQQPTVRTDKDGHFRVERMVPEVKFTLGIVQGRTVFVGEPRIGVKQVKPGETLDLGDIRVKPQ